MNMRFYRNSGQQRPGLLGKFDDELVPVSVPAAKKGDPIIVDIDEGFRSDATMESMARLKPLTEGGIVTAGNASQTKMMPPLHVWWLLKISWQS